jgi:N-acetylmuramoyl-L-alanine amidase
MPSVLVEAGFLSNARDRALVLSPRGQKTLSAAITQAVEQYRHTKGTPRAHLALSRCKVN